MKLVFATATFVFETCNTLIDHIKVIDPSLFVVNICSSIYPLAYEAIYILYCGWISLLHETISSIEWRTHTKKNENIRKNININRFKIEITHPLSIILIKNFYLNICSALISCAWCASSYPVIALNTQFACDTRILEWFFFYKNRSEVNFLPNYWFWHSPQGSRWNHPPWDFRTTWKFTIEIPKSECVHAI